MVNCNYLIFSACIVSELSCFSVRVCVFAPRRTALAPPTPPFSERRMFPLSSESIGRYISSLIKKATEDEMLKMRETYEERLRRTDEENQAKLKRMEEEKDKKLVVPHLWNLNEDPQLTGMLTHFVPPGNNSSI